MRRADVAAAVERLRATPRDRLDIDRRNMLPDAILAVVLTVAVVMNARALLGSGSAWFLLLMVAGLALMMRNRHPVITLGVVVLCVAMFFSEHEANSVTVVLVLVAVYAAVRNGHMVAALLIAGPFAISGLIFGIAESDEPTFLEAAQEEVLPIGWIAAAIVMGQAFRNWSAYVLEVEERAAEAERTREETARRRATDERLRIARELHDSLTHTISVIKVQAGVAVHLARKRGEEVPGSLLAIQEAANEANRELRSTLEVLRSETDTGGNDLDRLPELIRRFESIGLTIDLRISGQQRALSAETARTVYRIAQESLTNTSRHAKTDRATLHLDYAVDMLRVRVDDDGVQASDAAGIDYGVGLRGMRERVTALGGALQAGPLPSGGFRVEATLPVEPARKLAAATVDAGGEGPVSPSDSTREPTDDAE